MEGMHMPIWEMIVVICGGGAVIWGAIEIINKIVKPLVDLFKRVKKLESKITEHESIQGEFGGAIQALMLSNLALLDHGITGNSIDQLKGAKAQIQRYLINNRSDT
jgi:hypothetical protein